LLQRLLWRLPAQGSGRIAFSVILVCSSGTASKLTDAHFADRRTKTPRGGRRSGATAGRLAQTRLCSKALLPSHAQDAVRSDGGSKLLPGLAKPLQRPNKHCRAHLSARTPCIGHGMQ